MLQFRVFAYCYFYNGRNVVSILVSSFLDGSSSFLQETRTTIKAWMSLNFCQIRQLTTKLAAIEHLNSMSLFFSMLLLDCLFELM